MAKVIFIICLALLLLIPNGFSQSNNNLVLLYSQNSGQVFNIPFLPSFKQSDTTYGYQNCQIADDFTATSDWTIDKIIVIGDFEIENYIAGFNIYFYADKNGVPGELVNYIANQQYIISFIYYDIYECAISLEIPAILPAGDYWISVQGISTDFHWGWSWVQTNGTFSNTAMFKSHSYTSWVPVSTPFTTSFTEMNFELYGELLTSVELTTSTPSTYFLEQNYPNPFNPSTTIKYSIPVSEFVSLKVYDVLGNEIAVLVNEEKPAGTYEVEFAAEGLTSGIYFSKLHAGSFSETKKMILLR